MGDLVQPCASQSAACGPPEGSGHVFANIIRRLQGSYVPSPHRTKLEVTGLNDSKEEFTLKKKKSLLVREDEHSVGNGLENIEHLISETPHSSHLSGYLRCR